MRSYIDTFHACEKKHEAKWFEAHPKARVLISDCAKVSAILELCSQYSESGTTSVANVYRDDGNYVLIINVNGKAIYDYFYDVPEKGYEASEDLLYCNIAALIAGKTDIPTTTTADEYDLPSMVKVLTIADGAITYINPDDKGIVSLVLAALYLIKTYPEGALACRFY